MLVETQPAFAGRLNDKGNISAVGDGIGVAVAVAVGSNVDVGGMGEAVNVGGMDVGANVGGTGVEAEAQPLNRTVSTINI